MFLPIYDGKNLIKLSNSSLHIGQYFIFFKHATPIHAWQHGKRITFFSSLKHIQHKRGSSMHGAHAPHNHNCLHCSQNLFKIVGGLDSKFNP